MCELYEAQVLSTDESILGEMIAMLSERALYVCQCINSGVYECFLGHCVVACIQQVCILL